MQFRSTGKQKLLAFGRYPEVSLKEARRRRDEAREALAAGEDQSLKARLDKLAKRARRRL